MKVIFDSILIVVDKLIKWGSFILYLKVLLADDLTYIFLYWIIAEHSLLIKIISARDMLFKSRFWQALIVQLGIKHKLSTAYYPQRDS